jgi:hypothetical protein
MENAFDAHFVHQYIAHAPPPPAPPLRQRAMAQLLPVSVPAVIKDMAGKVV